MLVEPWGKKNAVAQALFFFSSAAIVVALFRFNHFACHSIPLIFRLIFYTARFYINLTFLTASKVITIRRMTGQQHRFDDRPCFQTAVVLFHLVVIRSELH